MVEPTKVMFAEQMPDVRLFNIADDSLIQEVIRANEVTPAVRKRLMGHYFAAVDAGADLIFNTCSSVGEVADAAREFLPVPIIQIDDAMIAQAVQRAGSIAILATLPTTLGPTVRRLQKQAAAIGKEINVVEGLAEGAFEAVISGDADTHDRLITDTAKRVAGQVDLIVLAQGSMARMEKTLAEQTGKQVLSSPLLGVLDVKEKIKQIHQ
jgi:aspartate/glutamate racemase